MAVLGTATVGLIGLVGLEALGGLVAVIAMLLAAVYPVLIEESGTLVAENLTNPFALLAYGISTLYCLTVSLAKGGAGLGTVWGQQLAGRMLRAAGF